MDQTAQRRRKISTTFHLIVCNSLFTPLPYHISIPISAGLNSNGANTLVMFEELGATDISQVKVVVIN